ncbi:MAG: LD-carboxypeptidase [Sphingomonas sp.]|nr:LD-carboxypeptidase [Sphingomonas sp.]
MGKASTIAVVAPGRALDASLVPLVQARAEAAGAELIVHPQCFADDGHFAGSDAERLDALRRVMADERVDAVWFARGGYGAGRIAEAAMADLPEAARGKAYMGYSDAGFLLAALHKVGCAVVHGPMPQDAAREGGEEALDRALAWLMRRDEATLEPGLSPGLPAMAFNLTVLSHLVGTPMAPTLTGVDLLIEDVGEYLYATDRALLHVTGQEEVRGVARLRHGRFSDVPENDVPFGQGLDDMVKSWCELSGIRHGGSADIGHDAANKIVPFGPRTA